MCIYGASYGGYAAMGAGCGRRISSGAPSYVGVTDLQLFHR